MTLDASYPTTTTDLGHEGLKRRKMDSDPASPTSWDNHSLSVPDDWKKFSFLNDQICHLNAARKTSSRDDLNYSQAWFSHYRRREHHFKPWNPTLGPMTVEWEWLRIRAIQSYWRATKNFRINPITIHLAVYLLNRLLFALRRKDENAQFSRDRFAAIVAVAFRTALKFEERPEALWSIRKIWEVLPMFDSWTIDRTEATLMKIETEVLKATDDCLDVPLAVQFFDKFVQVGGWPEDLIKEYTALGHFLLALSTFASGEAHPLSNIAPSKLAAATVVLSVKIVNNDSRRGYEFFPKRLEAFTQSSLKDLQAPIKGLSAMLRRRPDEARVLGRIYPEWGEHEWM